MISQQVVVSFLAKTAGFVSGVGVVEHSLEKVNKLVHGIGAGIVAGGTALGAGLAASTFKAASFEKEMRNVNSILGEGRQGFAALSDDILDLATKLPKSANDLAGGAYQVASAGFTVAKQTKQVLEASAKASVAGDTDTNTGVTAIATALHAYQLDASESTRVSDILFKTVEAGMVTFEQLAQNLGDFVGIGHAAGATLEETAASYAALTLGTGQYARSATAMNAIFRAMINPTETLKFVLEDLGVETGKQLIQQKGLGPAIRMITDAVGNEETALFDLFGNVEAVNGVLALNAQSQKEAADFAKQFTDEAELLGSTDRALAERKKALTYQIDQMKTAMGALSIEVGQAFLPAAKALVSILSFVVKGVNSIPDPVKHVLALFLGTTSVLALMGGAFLLFSGKIKLMRIAWQYLMPAIRAVIAMPVAQTFIAWARGTQIFNAAMAALGAGSLASLLARIGIIVGVVTAAKEVMESRPVRGFFIDQIDTKGAVDSLYKLRAGLEAAGAAGDDQRLGKNFENIDNLIRRLDWGAFKRNNPFTSVMFSQAVDDIDALDKALVGLAEVDPNNAARIFDVLRKKMLEQGITVPQLKNAFNDYYAAIAAGTAITNESAAAAEASAAAEERRAHDIEAARAAQDAYNDAIKDMIQGAQDFLSFQGALDRIVESHREVWDNAAGGMGDAADAADRLADAQDRLADAQANVEEIQTKINRLKYITGGTPLAGSQAEKDLAKLERDKAKATREIAKAGRDVNNKGETGGKGQFKDKEATVGEITKEINDQISRYNQFNKDLSTIGIRVGGEAGQGVIEELRKMGDQGAKLARSMAAAPPKEFDKLKGALADKARIEGEAYQKEVKAQMVTAAAIGAVGAKDGVAAILKEVDKLAPGMQAKESEIRKAAEAIGIAISEGLLGGKDAFGLMMRDADILKQKMLAAGKEIPGWLTLMTATVSPDQAAAITQYEAQQKGVAAQQAEVERAKAQAGQAGSIKFRGNARGGVDTQAHIQNSPTVLYGERETGGEAFVPRRGSKDRAAKTLQTAAGWYGMNVVPMAKGGVIGDSKAAPVDRLIELQDKMFALTPAFLGYQARKKLAKRMAVKELQRAIDENSERVERSAADAVGRHAKTGKYTPSIDAPEKEMTDYAALLRYQDDVGAFAETEYGRKYMIEKFGKEYLSDLNDRQITSMARAVLTEKAVGHVEELTAINLAKKFPSVKQRIAKNLPGQPQKYVDTLANNSKRGWMASLAWEGAKFAEKKLGSPISQQMEKPLPHKIYRVASAPARALSFVAGQQTKNQMNTQDSAWLDKLLLERGYTKNKAGQLIDKSGKLVKSGKRDQGGVLPPGTSLIQNNTGRNEYIRTPSQMVRSEGSGTASTTQVRSETTYKFGDIYAQDLEEAARQAKRRSRRNSLGGRK